jgi:hypothetical protein
MRTTNVSTYCFHPASQANIFQPLTKFNDLVVRDCFGRRLPEGFFDNDFDSGETFAPPLITLIAEQTDCPL